MDNKESREGGDKGSYTAYMAQMPVQAFVSTNDKVELLNEQGCEVSPASFFATRDHHLLVLNILFPKLSVSACPHGYNMAGFSKRSTLEAVFKNIFFPNCFWHFRVNERCKCSQKVTDTSKSLSILPFWLISFTPLGPGPFSRSLGQWGGEFHA